MKKITIAIFLVAPLCAAAAELEVQQVYRTSVALTATDFENKSVAVAVFADSKFLVLDIVENKKYLVKFTKIYQDEICKKESSIRPSCAKEGRAYYLDKLVNNIEIEKLVTRSFASWVSGPLIVPFKYRTKDKTFSGEATIGYYAGYGFDFLNQGIFITPFLSAGLTQISVLKQTPEGTETDNKTGFTWSIGLLVQNWDKVNIGIVYGQDRIGDSDWDYEGSGWWSVSVGWQI